MRCMMHVTCHTSHVKFPGATVEREVIWDEQGFGVFLCVMASTCWHRIGLLLMDLLCLLTYSR